MKTRSTSNYGTDSLGTEDASLNSSRYVRVTRRAAKARRQIMTKLTRQKGKKTKQKKQNLEADTESTEAKPRKTESACVLHKETTWGPFDEYDNEMTTLRHPKRRGPLMSPPPPRRVEDSDENPSQTQTQRGNPAATARRSGCNKYHPYIPEDVPALQADCLLRPKPTPPVDGLPLRKDLKGSVKGSNRILENTNDTTPSVTATQKQVKRKTVSRLGSLTKMSTAHKRPRQETVIRPARKILGERNFGY